MADRSAPDALILRRLTQADAAAFQRVVEIYLDVFPASERKPPDLLWRMLASDDDFMFELAQGDRTIGFAIVRRLEGVAAGLLEYMGVRRGEWGQGLGQRMFREITACPELTGRVLLLEVEQAGGDDPGGERARRQHFYRELGCRQVEGLNYRMPQVDTAQPPPMDLLVYAAPSLKSVDRTTVVTWVAAIYAGVYRRRTDDDQFGRIIKDVPDIAKLI